VSIVILNYNGESCLTDCLHSVLATAYPNFEVILVDNASQDQSLQTAQATFSGDPHLKIIPNPVNVGFAGGNNIGYNHAQGEYIVFLNNDTIVDADWLTPLVDAMQSDSSIGLAQSLILNIDGQTIQTAGWLFSDYLIAKYQLAQNRPATQRFEPTFEISFVCGASMMIRRAVAEEMGLFDASMPFFYDDTLLSLKTWLSRRRVVTVSSSRIRHIGGATNVWKIRFTTRHLMKANLTLLFDVYPKLRSLTGAVTVNLLYLGGSSLFMLKKRNVAALLGNLDAWSWGLRHLGFLWSNHLSHQAQSKVPPDVLEAKFVRIKIPVPFYFLPSNLSQRVLEAALLRHEYAVAGRR
jgi:GT2 family glycosyltransferase